MRYLPRQKGSNGKLTKVNVQISTDNGAKWTTVVEGQKLEANSAWQKIKFDKEYENVTNVKLIPVETAGDTANKFASAAELRVTTPFTPEKPEVDKTGLKKAIAEAEKLVKEDYTEESWNNMVKYLDAAKAVDANAEATQYDVSLAIANLGDAVKDLVAVEKPDQKPANKDALQSAVDKYSKYNKADYTADSWKKFEEALNHAKTVLADEDATQAEVDAAVSALNIAAEGLVPASNGNGNNNNNGNGNSGNTNSGNTQKPSKPSNKPIKTGDEAPVLPLTATVAGLGAAIALLFKKRK